MEDHGRKERCEKGHHAAVRELLRDSSHEVNGTDLVQTGMHMAMVLSLGGRLMHEAMDKRHHCRDASTRLAIREQLVRQAREPAIIAALELIGHGAVHG